MGLTSTMCQSASVMTMPSPRLAEDVGGKAQRQLGPLAFGDFRGRAAVADEVPGAVVHRLALTEKWRTVPAMAVEPYSNWRKVR